MTVTHPAASWSEGTEVQRTAALLGGAKTLKRPPRSRLDAHELLVRGLPGRALSHLIEQLSVLPFTPSLEQAVGISQRTFQRRKLDPARPLSREQSGRIWKFAEILAKATGVFGSQPEAERWLERPAIGLDQHRPIDLLATRAGVELVERHLDQIESGVYV